MTIDPLRPAPRPNGPALAAIVASGVGVFALGALTTASEASDAIARRLALDVVVGPLGGVTAVAVGAFVAAWLVLGVLWRARQLDERACFTTTFVLIALGVLGTFPLFFGRF